MKRREEENDGYGLGSLLGGSALAFSGVPDLAGGLMGASALGDIIADDPDPASLEALRDFLKRHPELNREGINYSDPRQPGIPFEAQRTGKGKGTVRLAAMDHPSIAHEVGHLDADNIFSTARHKIVDWQNEDPTKGRRFAANMAETFLAPIDESVAWKNAYKTAGSAEKKAKILKRIPKALGSYLARSGLRAGGLGLAGAGLYGLLSGDDE